MTIALCLPQLGVRPMPLQEIHWSWDQATAEIWGRNSLSRSPSCLATLWPWSPTLSQVASSSSLYLANRVFLWICFLGQTQRQKVMFLFGAVAPPALSQCLSRNKLCCPSLHLFEFFAVPRFWFRHKYKDQQHKKLKFYCSHGWAQKPQSLDFRNIGRKA